MTIRFGFWCSMLLGMSGFTACKSGKTDTKFHAAPGPVLMVYRLNGPWIDYVPVSLNEGKTAIVSYPAPGDLKQMKPPVKLKGDWWLDTRGITKNTAFVDFKVSEYINRTEAPSLEEMMFTIKTKTPFIELWSCGNSDPSKDLRRQANELKRKSLNECTCLVKK